MATVMEYLVRLLRVSARVKQLLNEDPQLAGGGATLRTLSAVIAFLVGGLNDLVAAVRAVNTTGGAFAVATFVRSVVALLVVRLDNAIAAAGAVDAAGRTETIAAEVAAVVALLTVLEDAVATSPFELAVLAAAAARAVLGAEVALLAVLLLELAVATARWQGAIGGAGIVVGLPLVCSGDEPRPGVV